MDLRRSRFRRERFLLLLSFALMTIPFLGPVVIRDAGRLENAAVASVNRVLVPDWYTPDTF